MDIVWPYCAITVDAWVSGRNDFPHTLQVYMEIQKFLVLFCRNESPRTLVHFCIFLPHLRTRRCVFLIWFSRYKFACTLPILLTKCSECPWTFRCNWTLHSRRICRGMRDQVQRRFWLCHYSLLSLLASFSPSFQGSWWSWNSKSSKLSWNGWCQINGEDGSTHHVASWCLVSIVPCFVNLKNVEHRTKLRRLRVQWNLIDIAQFKLSC